MNEKTVGMLAKFTGVSVHTIKYYEKIGLLSSTRKEHSNYRSYDIRSCTDIYECVKYKNLGFSLKDVGTLTKEADAVQMKKMLEERLQEIDGSIAELQKLRSRVAGYMEETDEIEQKLGKWYVEEMPDFYIRFQTRNLDYEDNGQLISGGINLMDYTPASKSILKIGREEFSWGQAIKAPYLEEGQVMIKGKEGYEYVKGGRAFVVYLKMTGPYASEGTLQKKIQEVYRQFRDEDHGEAYCVRIKITHDEDGNDWNYLKVYIPLEE